ncbi:MAG: NUDIX domain-containing protein [Candidatus Magasanikbacteria bacterium]|nr:NUDIX domain-containing protein [Candidatus Magasanikbacteria bacterium]
MAKVPPHAKKIFSGLLFNVYQWEQEMFDGSFKTFEMLWRVPTASVIATVGKKIITFDQQQPGRSPYPSLPGGKVEPGESPEEAGRRELLEEAGYSIKDLALFKLYNEHSKIDYDDYVFLAKNCVQTSKQNLDPGEKIKVKLVTFDQFLQLVRNPDTAIPRGLQHEMWEALLNKNKKTELKIRLGLV